MCDSKIETERKYGKEKRILCPFTALTEVGKQLNYLIELPQDISGINSGDVSLNEGGPILANVDCSLCHGRLHSIGGRDTIHFADVHTATLYFWRLWRLW